MMEVKGRDVVDSMPNFLPDEGIVGDVQREVNLDLANAVAKIQLGDMGQQESVIKAQELRDIEKYAYDSDKTTQEALARGLSSDIMFRELESRQRILEERDKQAKALFAERGF